MLSSIRRKDGHRYGLACYGVALGLLISAAILQRGGGGPSSSLLPQLSLLSSRAISSIALAVVAAPVCALVGLFLRNRLYLTDPEALAEYRATFEKNPLSVSFQTLGSLGKIMKILELSTPSSSGAGRVVAAKTKAEEAITTQQQQQQKQHQKKIRVKLYAEASTGDEPSPRLSIMIALYGGSPVRALKPFLELDIVSQFDMKEMLLMDVSAAGCSLSTFFDAFAKKKSNGIFDSNSEQHGRLMMIASGDHTATLQSPIGFENDANIIALLRDLNTYVGAISHLHHSRRNTSDEEEQVDRRFTTDQIATLLGRMVLTEFPWARTEHGETFHYDASSSSTSRGTTDVLLSVARYYVLLRHPIIGYTSDRLTELIEEGCDDDPRRRGGVLGQLLCSRNAVIILQALASHRVTTLEWRSRALSREINNNNTGGRFNSGGSNIKVSSYLANALWLFETLHTSQSSSMVVDKHIPSTCSEGELLTLLGLTTTTCGNPRSNYQRSWNLEDDDEHNKSKKEKSNYNNNGGGAVVDFVESLIVSFRAPPPTTKSGVKNVKRRDAVRRPPMDVVVKSTNSSSSRPSPLFTISAIAPVFQAAFPVANDDHGYFNNRHRPSNHQENRTTTPIPSSLTPNNNIILFCVYWEPLLRAHGKELVPKPLIQPICEIMELFDEQVQEILDTYNESNGLERLPPSSCAAQQGGGNNVKRGGIGRATVKESVSGPLPKIASTQRDEQCKADIRSLLTSFQSQFDSACVNHACGYQQRRNNNNTSFNWNGQSMASAGCTQQ